MSSVVSTLKPFHLDFSNRVIEHLGIKLYQNRPTNVVAEFVSNCWDADAKKVKIDLRAGGSSGQTDIVITDDGRGMTREELTDAFLIIGYNRRAAPTDKTPGGRTPMGRKGIGKLAGFGIAKTIDILSVPNPSLRGQSPPPAPKVYWLRFELAAMLASAVSAGPAGYPPVVMADGIDLNQFKALLDQQGCAEVFSEFLANASSGKGGVSVYLHDSSLKRALAPETLLRSLGSRFTVTMLRPDFVVSVNNQVIASEHALPPFQDFGFGSLNTPKVETITIDEIEREIKFWVKFVSLTDSDWSLENAGIGVYTHGKIAQDRPFFFGVRGKEIFSRYLYGVVEADWLDEMPEDVVSTDRRSVNWDTDVTAQLYTWGARKLSEWVEEFRKWRSTRPITDIVSRVRRVSQSGSLSGAEEEAVARLLNEVLPNLGNDEEAKDKTTKSFTEAWTHAPTRQLTKTLWEEVFASGESDVGVFSNLVEKLRTSMVPEAMGLAVTMAQRIAAITAMRRMIQNDQTETHLQHLVEQFPWLLGPEWEPLTANQTIRTLITQKHRPDMSVGEWSLTPAVGRLKPDFVFLSDVGEQKEIIVFELKGPECGKTLQIVEYQQLRQYLDIIRSAYPNRNIKVRGILVGHDRGGFEETDNRISVVLWADVLASARAMHVSYLAALLKASEPGATDARLKQIADFGGAETLELINRLAAIGDFDPIVTTALSSTPG